MPDGRSRRAAESREARRSQILDRAAPVFASRGYHGASVSDLVTAAGVARGTFYLYFSSKDEIFLALLDDLLRHLRAQVRGVDLRPDAPPIPDQLPAIVGRVLTTLLDNRPLARIVFREAVALGPAVDQRLAAFHQELHAWLAASLRVGQALGAVRTLDPELTATCLLGSLRGVVQDRVLASDAPVDVPGLTSALLDIAWRGIAAAPGPTATPS